MSKAVQANTPPLRGPVVPPKQIDPMLVRFFRPGAGLAPAISAGPVNKPTPSARALVLA